ncbi:PREDICTED: acyl-CoA synthetase family member 4 homolog isoform X5 [Bactrocera latifrons]|nr:PREDICTED: acyl-CoA synthetase family member 4 homolog isoform X5 [Bactrocera latifrons]
MIICTLDGSYCKIISNSGELVWLRKCESPIFSTPVIIGEDHSIILAEVSGNVHICNAENGELMQTFRAGSLIFSALTILKDMGSKGKVLFGSYDKYVYCLRYQNSVEKEQRNACKLDLLWKNQLESNIFASPLAVSLQDDEYVLCCSTSGLIAVLQVETGEMITKYKLSGEIFSTPCNLGNKIFIGCRDNFLYSFSIH